MKASLLFKIFIGILKDNIVQKSANTVEKVFVRQE